LVKSLKGGWLHFFILLIYFYFIGGTNKINLGEEIEQSFALPSLCESDEM